MTTQTFQEIAMKDIVVSGDSKRNILEGSEGFQELKASIAAGGVRIPIQVRLMSGKKAGYELRAGERRYRACRALGLKTIPAIVHSDMDDPAAVDLTYIENTFREDLLPMEQAQEVSMLMERFGGNAKAIAQKLGKSEQWVRIRAYIHGHLAKCWRDIFADIDKHPMFQTWSLTHLALIGRLPEHIQTDLHKHLRGSWEPHFEKACNCSTRDLETMIGASLHLLSKATWALDDGTLAPKAGACTECPKRSGHQPMLWFEMADQAQTGDQCLDGYCWQNKTDGWLKRRAKELKDQHNSLTLITKEHADYIEEERLAKAFGSFISKYAYKIVSKSTVGAIPAMYINGTASGQLTYIKPTAMSSGESKRVRTPGRPTPLKERQVQLDAKRSAQTLLDLRAKVGATEVSQITCKDKMTGLMALVAVYGNSPVRMMREGRQQQLKLILKAKDPAMKARESLWESFKSTLDAELTWIGPISQTPDHLKRQAEWIAGLIGVDLKGMLKDVCSRKGFTVPKSWASLNADGTPKAEKDKTAKPKNVKAKAKKAPASQGRPPGKAWQELLAGDKKRVCRVCGCTDAKACVVDGVPCHWVEPDLCSACEDKSTAK